MARGNTNAPATQPKPNVQPAGQASSQTEPDAAAARPVFLDAAVRELLDARFDSCDIRQDAVRQGESFQPKYPSPPALIRRLNEAFGHCWSDEIINIWNSPDNSQVLVHARLSITVEQDGKLVTIVKDGVGSCYLRMNAANNGLDNYGYDVKAAHTDAIRKAATKFGVSLHLYERDESHFQGYQRLNIPTNQKADTLAPRHMIDQVVGVLEGQYGLERGMWLKNLKLPAPEKISVKEAMQIIDGSHGFILWLDQNGFERRGQGDTAGGLRTEDV